MYQIHLPRALPFLQLFFPSDDADDVVVGLEPDELLDRVFLGETNGALKGSIIEDLGAGQMRCLKRTG
jgi:hypothetical protein